MTDTAIIEIALKTMLVALKLSAPILATSLVIGFAIRPFAPAAVTLVNSGTAIYGLVVAGIWNGVGVTMAVMLAGLVLALVGQVAPRAAVFLPHSFQEIPWHVRGLLCLRSYLCTSAARAASSRRRRSRHRPARPVAVRRY